MSQKFLMLFLTSEVKKIEQLFVIIDFKIVIFLFLDWLS